VVSLRLSRFPSSPSTSLVLQLIRNHPALHRRLYAHGLFHAILWRLCQPALLGAAGDGSADEDAAVVAATPYAQLLAATHRRAWPFPARVAGLPVVPLAAALTTTCRTVPREAPTPPPPSAAAAALPSPGSPATAPARVVPLPTDESERNLWISGAVHQESVVANVAAYALRPSVFAGIPAVAPVGPEMEGRPSILRSLVAPTFLLPPPPHAAPALTPPAITIMCQSRDKNSGRGLHERARENTASYGQGPNPRNGKASTSLLRELAAEGTGIARTVTSWSEDTKNTTHRSLRTNPVQ